MWEKGEGEGGEGDREEETHRVQTGGAVVTLHILGHNADGALLTA